MSFRTGGSVIDTSEWTVEAVSSWTRSETMWTRLLPRPREADLTEGLRAEIRDPLWMLGRQWQFREFQGEDAGSPVRADVRVERDHLTGYDLDPTERRAASPGPRPYGEEPLEALVEREAVVEGRGVGEEPPMRLACEAGLHFLRLLDRAGYRTADGDTYGALDFPADLRLSDPDVPLEASDQRYVSVMADRALDGHQVFERLSAAVPDIESGGADAETWGTDGATPPLPTDGSVTGAYREAAAAFHAWYRDLYFEPDAESGAAWRPERMEYGFAVSTGAGSTRTVFEADGYEGGHLDWDAFSLVDGPRRAVPPDEEGTDEPEGEDEPADPDPGAAGPTTRRVGAEVGRVSLPDERLPSPEESEADRTELWRRFDAADLGTGDHATSAFETSLLPTHVTFPGMPANRFWEFEDSAVTLSRIAGDGASLPRSLLLEFAVQFGNDWFEIPIPTPVGTYSRVTELTVADTFGVEETAEPVQRRTDGWNMFMFDSARTAGPGDEDTTEEPARPGLFLPPTLARSLSSEPLERVLLMRDELANLAFGIEQLVESPVGTPTERASFAVPRLAVERVVPGETPAEEYVSFVNAGEDDLALDGWTVERESGGATETVHRFEDLTLAPESTLRLYTAAPTAPVDEPGTVVRDCGRSEPLWGDATVLSAYAPRSPGDGEGDGDANGNDGGAGEEPADDGEPRLVLRHLLGAVTADAAYRLANEVPDHWFPFSMEHRAGEVEALDLTVEPGEYYLERALLLDASSLGVDPEFLPTPMGRILDPDPAELRDVDLADRTDADGTGAGDGDDTDGAGATDGDDAGDSDDTRRFDPLRVFEEEIPRSGKEVTRQHQLARWITGESYLWTGRRVAAGEGEGSSSLRFDFLEEEGNTTEAGTGGDST